MSETSPSNESQTASLNRSKAPQKVEVVVANPSAGSEVNILGELSIFILRIGFSILMIHHGLEKLQDPQGFAEFVVAGPGRLALFRKTNKITYYPKST